ncbi:PREDICTED: uncharacterized protein C14orf119 isoform X2 [Nicrophorus vespilloides]|nr:PREDICTED: uncharacterized protein C14orf119 isoform X2 [Nicrophorus vespilloides]XP_017768196.1 PREDICTED: uncharacterized protein C14orf119 isoform X2 [Nicrophorus vespilloides]XP_017768197.1 PREDICTED: uncharacterized protein C14orf119 isoform X2 [Nicrophorus vespilloides]
MTISVDTQIRYLVQWFNEWSELQRSDFLPVIAENFLNKTYVNGIVNSIANVDCQDKPMSLFQCRMKLFREWIPQWSSEHRDNYMKQITEIDPDFGEKLKQEMQNGVHSEMNGVGDELLED